LAKERKNKGGRPRKEFKQEWCNKLVKHMEQGYSFESFGGVISCAKDTLYTLLERHPEFSDAKKLGESKSRLFWERAGIEGMNGMIKGFVSGTWIFNMKNRFGWADKQEVTGKDGEPIITAVTVNVVKSKSDLIDE
jgi:hypothetical protein